MKLYKKYLSFLGLLLALGISCQKQEKMNKAFRWEEKISCPLGYPVEVYRGGLTSEDGGFTSLYMGIITGKYGWGHPGGGMRDGVKSVPNHLHVIWLSYAEDCFYEIETEIDYKKMVTLFQEGYITPLDPSRPYPFKKNYSQIVTGFAPGGVVVIWLAGSGRQVEIGRYQGKQVSIPKEEIASLDYPDKNLFDPEFRKKMMKRKGVVPLEVQEENKDKPIPYGLWNTYRKRYLWSTSFNLPYEGILYDVSYFMFNGEIEILFGDYLINKYSVRDDLQWKYLSQRSIPKKIYFSWMDKDQIYTGAVDFNEKEIFEAFDKIFSDAPKDTQAEFVIRVNEPKNFASVKLQGNGKEVWLKNNKVVIY